MVVFVKRFVTLVIVYLASAGVQAVTLTCDGKIEGVHLGSWHGLYVKMDWNPNYMRICDIDGGHNGVPGQVCDKWVGILTAAFLAEANTRFWYENRAAGETCDSFPSNSNAPSPGSVYLIK